MSKYSDILKKKPIEPEVCTPSIINVSDNTENQRIKPKKRKQFHCYNTWEFVYFEHLLNLRDMFYEKITPLFPEWKKYIMSEEFFYKFSHTIYEGSSTLYPVYPQPMSKTIENVYREYLIKREKI